MRQLLKEWYTGEPSAYEYADALDRAQKRINDRYYPFKVSGLHLYNNIANDTAKIIALPNESFCYIYVLDIDWGVQRSGKLYGPIDCADDTVYKYGRNAHRLLSKDNFIGKFSSLDGVMNYLFNNPDIMTNIDLYESLEDDYNELQNVAKDWHNHSNKFYKYINKARKTLNDKQLYNDDEYKRLRAEEDDFIAKHSNLTRKFKQNYQNHLKAGGKSDNRYYQASTEWDDCD